MKIIGVIPSRYESSRFPGKPLADICGKPMVWWVYNQAIKVSQFDEIYVATDDERILNCCKEFSIPCLLTSKEHVNGTERVAEVADITDADIYITLQGDEPLMESFNIEKIINLMMSDSNIQCATLKTAYHDPVDVINCTTPKVVSDLQGNVMLFTRFPVPYPKASLNYKIFKPMGLYGFRRSALLSYSGLEMGPIEKAEDIELLRFIENGIKIRIEETQSQTVAVDTPKDLQRVRDILTRSGP